MAFERGECGSDNTQNLSGIPKSNLNFIDI